MNVCLTKRGQYNVAFAFVLIVYYCGKATLLNENGGNQKQMGKQ